MLITIFNEQLNQTYIYLSEIVLIKKNKYFCSYLKDTLHKWFKLP